MSPVANLSKNLQIQLLTFIKHLDIITNPRRYGRCQKFPYSAAKEAKKESENKTIEGNCASHTSQLVEQAHVNYPLASLPPGSACSTSFPPTPDNAVMMGRQENRAGFLWPEGSGTMAAWGVELGPGSTTCAMEDSTASISSPGDRSHPKPIDHPTFSL